MYSNKCYYSIQVPSPDEAPNSSPFTKTWYASMAIAVVALVTLGAAVIDHSASGKSIATYVGLSVPTMQNPAFAVAQRPNMQLGNVVDPSNFKKGLTVELDGVPHRIVDYQQSKQARQAAVTRTKLQNLLTGMADLPLPASWPGPRLRFWR